jgi:hypothetical protein|tara:strand:+ start:140 stop:541 length:402 start_codon:yes stop_codon:yes gene_type:complete
MRISVLLVIFLFLVGCAASSHILVGEAREPIDPSNVKIYLDYPEKYEKIALIDAGSNFAFKDPEILFDWQSKMDKAMQRLKIEAAQLGANGILIVNTDNKILTSVSSDGQGGSQTSTTTEKFVKAIAIYVDNE